MADVFGWTVLVIAAVLSGLWFVLAVRVWAERPGKAIDVLCSRPWCRNRIALLEAERDRWRAHARKGDAVIVLLSWLVLALVLF